MGADEYSKLGIPESPGTKIFTISGDVERPGFYELEMGATLRQLIYDLAGGVKNKAELMAVLIGGAAGTFVDKTVLDTPMGYDSLKEKGAVLGSGAIMVLNSTRSLKMMLQSILEFFKHESCGKCVPCRVGTDRLVRMIEDINKGREQGFTLDDMVEEAQNISRTSLCPLGQSPILPLASLKRYFDDHFKS
jgi:NADH-quinone oxidoreductase subunit F